jgi:hypothetical protein
LFSKISEDFIPGQLFVLLKQFLDDRLIFQNNNDVDLDVLLLNRYMKLNELNSIINGLRKYLYSESDDMIEDYKNKINQMFESAYEDGPINVMNDLKNEKKHKHLPLEVEFEKIFKKFYNFYHKYFLIADECRNQIIRLIYLNTTTFGETYFKIIIDNFLNSKLSLKYNFFTGSNQFINTNPFYDILYILGEIPISDLVTRPVKYELFGTLNEKKTINLI